MRGRRAVVGPAVLLLALAIATHAAAAADPASFVDPFVGTAGSGNTFPGATLPFGMVQFSPSTLPGSRGGYRFGDTTLQGLALTRLSGAGCSNYGDLPLLPVPSPPAAATAQAAQTTSFSHAHEVARPGFYGVRLDSGIDVALTATTRTGLARFTFPATATAGTVLMSPSEAANARTATIATEGRTTVLGSSTSVAFTGACGALPGTYTLYFAAVFDRPWSATSTDATGVQTGASFTFDTSARRDVSVKIGVSFVSTDDALLNLQHEGTSWNVTAVAARARAQWDALLGRVHVDDGSQAVRETFYTALYHALLHPNVASDVDGRYLGVDGAVHAGSRIHYTNVSGWDVYRSQIPLLALVAPAQTSDIAQSLVDDASAIGRLPKWLLANVETGILVGDPSDAILAEAYAFGARRFDARLALRELTAGATDPTSVRLPGGATYVERPRLADYLARGYVPGAASTTLEYALADFAVSRLARALGDAGDTRLFLGRSANWRKVFDPTTGLVEPRRPDGTFDESGASGFVEGDAAQYTLLVPQDFRDLLAAMGPRSAVVSRLDAFFSELNAGPTAPHAWLGNEPSFFAPFAYVWLGAPARTQAVVRRALTTLFSTLPDGLPGNDDLGATSAWYVLGALGLYPAIPGVAGFAVTTPLFPHVTVELAGGRSLELTTRGSGGYVRSLTLDGRPWRSTWLPLSALGRRSRLVFTLSRTPTTWGAAAPPPSFAP
jgi:predicted alpha-1,2-mannosidase